MSWNQRHCEDYQTLIPTIVHGSKSELEWPIYHENRDDASINAPQTFESHNFQSDCWIFKIHTFSKTGSQDLSRSVRIHSFWGLFVTSKNEDTHFFEIRLLPSLSTHFFSLPNTKKHSKHSSKFLDSSLFTKNTRYCSYNQSSFPWFYSLNLRFMGVDVAFLAIIHTPNLLNLFLAFIFLLCLNNMIYCFL